MTNPWLEWWEEVTSRWGMLTPSSILNQLAVLGTALAVALVLDRVLEQHRGRWLKAPPEQRKIRTVLWAAKLPLLVLLLGSLALSIYSATDRPTYALDQLVNLFWFITLYALLSKSVTTLLPASDASRIIRRVLLPLLAIVGALHLVGLLPILWAWASQPVVTLASTKITLSSIGLALGIAAAFWVAARAGKSLFLKTILPRTETDPELARSVAGFIQFAIILMGLWVGVSTLGISVSNLTLLISALTVGIGFGLQDVVKNIMGGVILLGEGHVRPNEVFKIGSETGIVERIGIRSTTLHTWDGAEVIVPNADLIAEKVTDLSNSRRVKISVGVSCNADPRRAERLLIEIAAAHPEVVDDPPPSVLFANLGESTFDFVLYCFVDDRSKVLRTQSDLHYAVVDTFAQHDLEMPYRQLDIHLRSGPWAQINSPPAA